MSALRCASCAKLHAVFTLLPGVHGDRPPPPSTPLPCVHVALVRVLETGRAEYTTALGGFVGGCDGEVELRVRAEPYPPIAPWPPRRVVGLYSVDGVDLGRSIHDEWIPVVDPAQATAIRDELRTRKDGWGPSLFEKAVAPQLRAMWNAP